MKKYIPLIISLLLFYSVIFFLVIFSLGYTNGHFLYTLDDPYIHMAIAKNFVTSGTWGITRYEFSSCSSSPLWTFLISVFFFIFGINTVLPFLLNILFASLTGYIAFGLIRKYTENIFVSTIILLSILFFGPFISVVFTGLEHMMYTFFVVLIIFYLFKIFEDGYSRKNLTILLIISALLTLSRYEGMFIAGGIFLVFLYKKKVLTAFGILISAFLPVVLIGLYSVSKGWYFFPNSVMLKSSVSLNDFYSLIGSIYNPNFFDMLWAYKRILILLIISLVIFVINRKDENSFAIKSSIFIFVLVTILQIQYAKLGSLLRYEMYIIVTGILINTIGILKYLNGKSKKIKYTVYIFLCLLMIPYSVSTYKASEDVPVAMGNVYQMQFQMSNFINRYYSGSTIALNDIGAVNFYCNIRCVDLWGLANKEAGEYRRKNIYNPERIYKLCKDNNTSIAIVFESWYEKYGGLPSSWKIAGKWTIPDNITCGADSVTFYATDSAGLFKLKENLRLFSAELPKQVKQTGY